MENHQHLPIFPGDGGLNTEINPLLLDDADASAVDNVDFDQKSIAKSAGWRKLHPDRPRLAGLNFRPRPIGTVSASLEPARCPFGMIPYLEAQDSWAAADVDARDGYQIDVSFRLNSTAEVVLTGESQGGTNKVRERFNAPEGGEFQFQPLISRGGSDVEELAWTLGLAVVGPGFDDAVTQAGLPTTDQAPRVIRPVFYWWDPLITIAGGTVRPRMRFAVANVQIVPGIDYHLTLQLGATVSASQWFLNAIPIGQFGVVAAVAPQTSEELGGFSPLPAAGDLDRTYHWPLYISRPMTRSVGVYPHARVFRGVYGISIVIAHATQLLFNIGELQGRIGGKVVGWSGYYARCTGGTAANVGQIRKIIAYDGIQTLTLSTAFPAATNINDTFDIVPPMEPNNQDVTIQGLAIWRRLQTNATILLLLGEVLLKDIRRTDPPENFAASIGAETQDLVGYWPMIDDGGAIIEDRSSYANSGWLAGSPCHPEESSASITLDGERTSLQYDLLDEQVFQREIQYNLGLRGSYRIHGRVTFDFCRDMVPRNCVKIVCDPGGGTLGDTITIDGVVFTIVAGPGVPPQVDIGYNGNGLAANLVSSIVSVIGTLLGVYVFPVEAVGNVVYICTIDPVTPLVVTEIGTSFTIESGFERSHYETIFDWDDPEAETPAPVLSLRWSHHDANRKFWIVWNTGVEERHEEVAWAPDTATAHSIQPHIGRRFTLFFGVQSEFDGTYHRLYVLLTDGQTVRGWSSLLSGIPRPSLASIKKSRISFGANVVAQESAATFEGRPIRFGAGTHNAAFIRIHEAGFSLRPFVKTPAPAGLPIVGSNPVPIDRWTSLDRLVTPDDIEPRISEAASLVNLTKGSKVFSSSSGASWSSDLDGIPVPGYLVVLKSEILKRAEKNKETYHRPRFLHVEFFDGVTTGQLSEQWEGRDLEGAEIRIASYLAYVAFRHPLHEFPLNSRPKKGAWATTEIYPDEGILGSVGPVRWLVGILPIEAGTPQSLFTGEWGPGILRGCVPVTGLAQLKRTDGIRRTVESVGGSIYDVRTRWVNDHPFEELTDLQGRPNQYSFALQNVSRDKASQLEEIQDELVRSSRRQDPEPFEFWEVGNQTSGSPCRLWIPNNLSYFSGLGMTSLTWRMLFWVKLDSLDGRRTISSRVGGLIVNVAGVSGNWKDYKEQINHWFGIEEGALFLKIETNVAPAWSYRIDLANDTKSKTRNRIPVGRWVQLGFVLRFDLVADSITDAWFSIDGILTQDIVTTTSGAPKLSTIPEIAGERGRIGAYGSTNLGSWLPLRWGLGAQVSRFSIDYDEAPFQTAIPTFDIPAGSGFHTIYLVGDLNEGFGFRSYLSSPAGLNPGALIFRGRGALPLAHGYKRGRDQASFAQFRERLYGTHGGSPVFEYDGYSIVRAGLAPPAEEPELDHVRKEIRPVEAGAAFPEDLTTGRCTLAVASPQLTAGTGWFPSEADVGKLVVVPSEKAFQGAVASDGPSYIGVISAIISSTAGTVDLLPVPTADQAGATLAFMVFDAKSDDVTLTSTSYLRALEKLEATTPYALTRLVPNGMQQNTVPLKLDEAGAPPPAVAEQRYFEFKGNHSVEVRNIPPLGNRYPTVGHDTVLDVKCYIRFDRLETAGGAAQILFERRDDPDTASWEIAVIDQGRVRFRFWDEQEEVWKQIESVGRCFTVDEWYYFRFRYRFKRAGASILDTEGGWETDSRHEFRDHNAANYKRYFRDGLWCWALENKNPSDPFLVIPGCQNAFTEASATPKTQIKGISRMPGNVGYLAERPWMGHQSGDPQYTWTWSAIQAAPPVAMQVTFAAGAAGVDAGVTEFIMTTAAAKAAWYPRWWSINRDEPWHQNAAGGKKQISQAGGTYYNHIVGTNPARTLGSTANLNQPTKKRAVLCYVYGVAGAASPFAVPRILAVKDVGDNDLNGVVREGAAVVPIRLSDDKMLGADGGGALAGGAANYIVAFALPNGKNHSANATGNTDPLPTLLIQGEHPVGVQDRPTKGSVAVRVGGPERPDLQRNGLLGLEARIGDFGFSYRTLDRTTTRVYTEDQMPPDCDFHGPVDTRVGSLPYIQLKDYTNGSMDVPAGDNRASSATWSMRGGVGSGFDVPVGVLEGAAISGRLTRVNDRLVGTGTYKVIVTFVDPDRLVESPASPEGFVEVSVDDETESFIAAESKFLVTLPISPDRRRRVWRRVYITLPDGSIFLSTPEMEVRDNRTRAIEISPSLTELEQSRRFDFGYALPPLCSHLIATESRLVFGGVAEAPSVVAWSDAFYPERVPGTNRELLESGEGNPVTGLAYLNGSVYAFKRDSLFVVDLNIPVGARVLRLQSNTGAVSHDSIVGVEDNLVFVAEKGVYAFDGSSRAYYMSPQLEGEFGSLSRERGLFVATYSRKRNQYLFAARSEAYGEPRLLYTGGIPDSPMTETQKLAWSRQYHPQGITALESIDDARTDEQIIVAGTYMGFAIQLDVDTGSRGYETDPIYLDDQLTVFSVAAGGNIVVAAASLDLEEDALSGIPFVALRTTGGVQRVVSEGWIYKPTTALSLQVARPRELSVLANDGIHVGGWRGEWWSKWFDFRAFTMRKHVHYLDIIFSSESGGEFLFEGYYDFSTTPAISRVVNMTRGWDLVAISINSGFFRFRIQRAGNRRPFDVFSMNLRFELETQREAQRGT